MSVVAADAVPVVATALSSAPETAGRVPRRSPFAAQVAGLTVCRKELVVSDILPGSVAHVKRLKCEAPESESFELMVQKRVPSSPTIGACGLGEWTDAAPVLMDGSNCSGFACRVRKQVVR